MQMSKWVVKERRATQRIILATAFLAAHASFGQSASSGQSASVPTISSATTLVAVPTLVRLPSGEFVKSVDASHFHLLDNGIRQWVSMEDREDQPIAVAVVMQVGGQGSDQFASYRNLPQVLDAIVGNADHEVMLVTFDSHVKDTWYFPVRTDAVYHAISHPLAGDGGVAILDAVNHAVTLLHQEPGNFRRIVLLLSQPQDDGSETSAEEVVRQLGESSTTVYSLTFSPNRPSPLFGSNRQDSKARHERSSHGSSKDETPADRAKPLEIALKAMRKNTAEEMSALSGGGHLKFRNATELEARLSAIADDIHNRHILSFQPILHQPGFHMLAVQLEPQKAHFDILARTSYWNEEGAAAK
jgi:VWFA-related protein